MREAELQRLVLESAKAHGLLAYHTFDSRRSQPGFPDLVLVGRHGVFFRELKSETGRTSKEQEFWLAALLAAQGQIEIWGHQVPGSSVWRPSDWPTRVVAEMKLMGRVQVVPPVMTQAEVVRKLRSRAKK